MTNKKNIASFYSATVMLILAIGITAISAQSYLRLRSPELEVDRVIPGKETENKKLSEYFDGIKETPADTDVYIKEGSEPGGTFLVLGGTHANEPAGFISAVLFLENVRVKRGRVIIVPYANMMGRTHTYPQDAHPQFIHFKTPNDTTRTFRFGARTTNPVWEWPNPDIYVHPDSGQTMAGVERSNLNRAYPGVPDGCLTERLAYGIMQLIEQEKVDLAIDLHEASPEYPVVDAIVAHERGMELAAMVSMELEMDGIAMRLEPSPQNLRGLSHREWGDSSDVMAFLTETANPGSGRFRGKTDENLVLTGIDKAYRKAQKLGQLYVDYSSGEAPIAERVARHVTVVNALAVNLGFVKEGKDIELEGIPDYETIKSKGVGAFLAE